MARIDELRVESKELLREIVDTSLFDDITEGSASAIDINITLGFRPGQRVSILSAEKVVRYDILGARSVRGRNEDNTDGSDTRDYQVKQ